MTPTLVVMAGLPGTGKSTVAGRLAEELGWPVFSVDPIESAILQSGIEKCFETGLAAYVVAQALARENLRVGNACIVDAVNSTEPARAMWRSVSRETGANLHIVECVCSDLDLHQARVEARRRDLPGLEDISWAAVQERREEYEPWNEDRYILDTAAVIEWHALLASLDSKRVPFA